MEIVGISTISSSSLCLFNHRETITHEEMHIQYLDIALYTMEKCMYSVKYLSRNYRIACVGHTHSFETKKFG